MLKAVTLDKRQERTRGSQINYVRSAKLQNQGVGSHVLGHDSVHKRKRLCKASRIYSSSGYIVSIFVNRMMALGI